MNTISNNSTEQIFRDYILKYLSKWYWFVISVFICLFFGIAYILVTPKSYDVRTSILLRQNDKSSAFSETAMLENLGFGGMNKQIDDELTIISSRTILKNSIEDLDIATEYYKKTGFKYLDTYPLKPIEIITQNGFNSRLRKNLLIKVSYEDNTYTINWSYGDSIKEKLKVKDLTQPLNTPDGPVRIKLNDLKPASYKIIAYPIDNITQNYREQLSISQTNKKANSITLSITAANTSKAIDLLNKVVELYNMDAVIDKNMIATNTQNFIEDRLKLVQGELLDVELAVEDYKKKNNLTDLQSEATLYLQTYSDYEKKLSELETQINLTNYLYSYVKENKNQHSLIPTTLLSNGKSSMNQSTAGSALPVNLGIQDPVLIQAIQDYNEALMDRMKLLRSTNSSNPVISDLDQKLTTLRNNIVLSLENSKKGLTITKNDLVGKDKQFTSKIKQVPTQERQFLEIKRQQEIKQQLYLFLLQKREENAVSLASTVPSAKTLDKAYASLLPVAPKTKVVLIIALLIGIAIPIGIIYVIDLLDNKISSKKDLTSRINAPFLGVVGVNKENDRVVVREGKTTPIVEMFRMVRTNLQFMLGSNKHPVILVTSSMGGEGKSFTSINLSMSLALTKKKVILVGLDIRKPMLGEYMHIPKNTGATLFLSDSSYKLEDIIVPSGFHPSLDVIPAGPIPPNPSELLMSDRLEELINALKEKYDYIIIDSAPVGVVSDTFLINRVIDNAIYVSRQNYTPKDVTELINEIHDQSKLTNLSVILNGVSESSGGYGYGYGYGYNLSKKEKKKYEFMK